MQFISNPPTSHSVQHSVKLATTGSIVPLIQFWVVIVFNGVCSQLQAVCRMLGAAGSGDVPATHMLGNLQRKAVGFFSPAIKERSLKQEEPRGSKAYTISTNLDGHASHAAAAAVHQHVAA